MTRVGLLMKKIGCTSIYDANSKPIPVTLLQLEYNCVVSCASQKDFNLVKVSFGDLKKVNKPQKCYFEKLGIEKMGRIIEFKVDQANSPEVMYSFSVNHFRDNQFVDVVGISIGKGFAGVMKRHNFSGLRASHGVSLKHRSGGSTGQCQDPGKTAKGKKMAGHLGAKKVTVQNLKIRGIYEEMSIIAVGGSVPGHKNSYVLVRDAIKKSLAF